MNNKEPMPLPLNWNGDLHIRPCYTETVGDETLVHEVKDHATPIEFWSIYACHPGKFTWIADRPTHAETEALARSLLAGRKSNLELLQLAVKAADAFYEALSVLEDGLTSGKDYVIGDNNRVEEKVVELMDIGGDVTPEDLQEVIELLRQPEGEG